MQDNDNGRSRRIRGEDGGEPGQLVVLDAERAAKERRSAGGLVTDPDEQELAGGPISLDRHLTRRRSAMRSVWPQLATIVFMLLALVAVVVFRDRCANAVSQAVGILAAPGPEAIDALPSGSGGGPDSGARR